MALLGAHVGLGFGNGQMYTYNHGQEQRWMREPVQNPIVHVKVTSRANIVTFHYCVDGQRWLQHPWQMEVSGLHHNVFGGFLSLRLALFAGR